MNFDKQPIKKEPERGVGMAMKLLLSALSERFTSPPTSTKRRARFGLAKKTQPGAVHDVNPTFKSTPGNVTPAEYRRRHLGSKSAKG